MSTRRDPMLWVALAIPVVMIILVGAAILLPRLFVKPPQFSFLYSTFDNTHANFANSYDYSVDSNGKLMRYATNDPGHTSSDGPVDSRILYEYDIATHQSKQISFADAQNIHLDANHTSADGYDVETGNSDGAFPFGDGGSGDQYLTKASYSERLNIANMFGNTYYDFQFLGWVIR